MTISEAPYSGPREEGLLRLEQKKEISCTLGKAVRNLMLHSPPAQFLLLLENTSNWTVQVACSRGLQEATCFFCLSFELS